MIIRKSIFKVINLSRTFYEEFPKRKDSIKKLKNKEYLNLAKDFKSYGNFVNYCNNYSIPTKSIERREVLTKIFEYQNMYINDVDYSEKLKESTIKENSECKEINN